MTTNNSINENIDNANDEAAYAIVIGATPEHTLAWGTLEQARRIAELLDDACPALTSRWDRLATQDEIDGNDVRDDMLVLKGQYEVYTSQAWIDELEWECKHLEDEAEREAERRAEDLELETFSD